MPKSGFVKKNMEKRLRRAGVHPHDIKTAADFVERAIKRDEAAKNIQKGVKNYEQTKRS